MMLSLSTSALRRRLATAVSLVLSLASADATAQPDPPVPPRADSDDDGLDDTSEDRNRNGRVDDGETDPHNADSDGDRRSDGAERAIGSDPRRRDDAPVLPEPMVFDLVRGLGAHRGEFEANVLALRPLTTSARGWEWGPEVEYAFAEGHSVELEVPFHDERPYSLKLGLQGTFGYGRQFPYVHGWLVLAEAPFERKALQGSLLYVVGARWGHRVSTLALVGARVERAEGLERPRLDVLFNPSVFVDLTPRLVVGLEHNLAQDVRGGTSWLLMPQAHVWLGGTWTLQAGLGVGTSGGGTRAIGALRLVTQL